MKNEPYSSNKNGYKNRAIHADNKRPDLLQTAYSTAVDAIRYIQGIFSHRLCDRRPIFIAATIPGSTADLDNVTKTICDGLQGIAFENDRQIKGFFVFFDTETKESIIKLFEFDVVECRDLFEKI
jgi:Holliday junction resolvase RusA-like endonuclease